MKSLKEFLKEFVHYIPSILYMSAPIIGVYRYHNACVLISMFILAFLSENVLRDLFPELHRFDVDNSDNSKNEDNGK